MPRTTRKNKKCANAVAERVRHVNTGSGRGYSSTRQALSVQGRADGTTAPLSDSSSTVSASGSVVRR